MRPARAPGVSSMPVSVEARVPFVALLGRRMPIPWPIIWDSRREPSLRTGLAMAQLGVGVGDLVC